MRGVPADIGAVEIKKELLELGFGIETVFQYSHVRDGTKVYIPVYFLELKNDTHNKGIFNMTSIFNLKISVDSYKKSNQPTQCHRCQRYGHAQSCCKNPARCVKCAGCHLTVDCPTRGRVDSPKCALCGGDHTANYRGCPKRPKPAETHGENTAEPNTHNQHNNRRQNNTTRSQVDRINEARPVITSAPVREGVSYANAFTAGPSATPQQQKVIATENKAATQVKAKPQPKNGEKQLSTQT